MMTKKDPNFSEDEYILQTLTHLVVELETAKPQPQILDKYACMLTAYMRGQQSVTIKKRTFAEWLSDEYPSLDLQDKQNKMIIEFMKEAYEA